MADPKIIILTPVKNEDWILDQFLRIASLFADHIIIADQHSTDASRDICNQFPKVHLVTNHSAEFNEAERQDLLIETARKLFPDNKRILLALDADELFSADSLYCTDTWNKIKSSAEGITLYFEKPDILPGVTQCVRYPDNYFAIGYVDDGVKHSTKFIHSKRVPEHANKKAVWIDDIKILHFAHSRKNVQSSKLRYYSVIENIENIHPVYLRRSIYACHYNEKKFYAPRKSESIPVQWLKEWEEKGIDVKNFKDPEISWFDFEVLRFFKDFGSKRFHLDNIWCFDWEACRQVAVAMNKDVPIEKIEPPGMIKKTVANAIDAAYRLYKRFKKN
jgi:hypothetical protein